ncbi:MAG: helix-turn-helix domain-containing protein [Alicyclobacillus herbarius]|uniref:helix-turn-helix domain-containing protein n=1 Tax=Alicyclobacillus herbarius TaxID=122960 RepID=UPI002352951B|nr:helix-turn-helix domain-containing protein [Alicyclobacillus herbarius]MCL6633938.1 helix-turn-helix domain-containing protein [Alicyclobacillus herbarius]
MDSNEHNRPLSLGERIHNLRIQKGLSLSELAEKASIAKSYLSSIERGLQANPTVQVLDKLAQVLDVSVQDLLQEKPETDPQELDPTWLELIREAMESGVSKQQFREFLEFQKWRKQNGEV